MMAPQQSQRLEHLEMRTKPKTDALFAAADTRKSVPLEYHRTHTAAEIAEAEVFCRKQREALARLNSSPAVG
jgi:hypothetical protein